MNNYLSLSLLIGLLYFGLKYIERKVRNEELKSKLLIKDAIFVSLCVFIGNVIYDQVAPIAETVTSSAKSTYVFTDEPGF